MNRGVLDMMVATIAFTAMIGFVRASDGVAVPLELVFWRGVVGVVVTAALVRERDFSVRQRPLLLVRILLGVSAMACFFTAASRLSVTEVSLISKLQPVLITALAPLVLGAAERVDRGVLGALAVGLVGCVVLLAPDALAGSWWGLWAVAAALFSASAHVCVRGLGRTEVPRVVVFWFQLGAAVLAWFGASLQLGRPLGLPDPAAWPWILGIGLSATAGQLFMTRAYQRERAAAVAASTYTGPLWAVLGDVVFFGLIPGWNALAGGVLVLGAGLWLLTGGSPGRAWASYRERSAS